MLTSRTKDLKQGEAKLAWDYMIEMYAGIHTTDKMKLEKQFNELKWFLEPTLTSGLQI